MLTGQPQGSHPRRVLEPGDRIAEVLFGLIMVLTFTGSLSIAEAGRDDVRTMLIGALGCNLAWGIIDGLFYVMGSLAEKGRYLATDRAIHGAADPARARQLIADALPAVVASALEPDDLERIRRRILRLPAPAGRPRLDPADWRGALGVFLLVFLSTFPVALPFLLVHDVRVAMRVSNAVAVVMLFAAGEVYGRIAGQRRWLAGFAMVLVGGALVTLTIALGG